MGKGSNTTTQQSTIGPNAQVGQADLSLISQAQQTAGTPFQGQALQVAPLTANQNAGIAGIASANGIQNPYLAAAQGYAQTGAGPISSNAISNYLNPYTQDVTNATLAQINQQNQVQQNQLQGSTVGSGGLGNSRLGVMQAQLAGQQAQQTNSTLANLNSQNYIQALQAAQQDAQRAGYGAFTEGNLGMEAQQGALTGNQAQINAGGLQQQEQQAQNQSQYNLLQQQNAYPFQTQSWLSSILGQAGNQLGSTSSSSTTQPAPNSWNSILGLGTAGVGAIGQAGGWGALGALLARGGRVRGYAGGGGVMPYGMASMSPYGGVLGYVPVTSGGGYGGLMQAPQARSAQPAQSADPDFSRLANNLTSAIGGIQAGYQSAQPASWAPTVTLGDGSGWSPTISGFRRGGGVVPRGMPIGMATTSNPLMSSGFADGGMVDDGMSDYGFDPTGVNGPMGGPAVDAMSQGVVPSSQMGFGGQGLTPPPTAPQVASAQPQPASQPQGVQPPASGNPWTALMAAGFGMAASPSPFLGEAIGQGGLRGLQAYDQSTQEAQRQQQQGSSNKMEQSKIDLEAKRLDQAADEAQKRLSIEGEKAQQGKYTPVMLTQPDANGNPVQGTAAFNTKTGQTDGFKAGTSMTRANPALQLFQVKQQAYLAAHPGDQAGALDFANGRKEMTPMEYNMAEQRLVMQAQQNGVDIADPAFQNKVQLLHSMASNSIAQQGKPAAQTGQGSPQGGADPSAALAAAKQAIAGGKDPNAVGARLIQMGIPLDALKGAGIPVPAGGP